MLDIFKNTLTFSAYTDCAENYSARRIQKSPQNFIKWVQFRNKKLLGAILQMEAQAWAA